MTKPAGSDTGDPQINSCRALGMWDTLGTWDRKEGRASQALYTSEGVETGRGGLANFYAAKEVGA